MPNERSMSLYIIYDSFMHIERRIYTVLYYIYLDRCLINIPKPIFPIVTELLAGKFNGDRYFPIFVIHFDIVRHIYSILHRNSLYN